MKDEGAVFFFLILRMSVYLLTTIFDLFFFFIQSNRNPSELCYLGKISKKGRNEYIFAQNYSGFGSFLSVSFTHKKNGTDRSKNTPAAGKIHGLP